MKKNTLKTICFFLLIMHISCKAQIINRPTQPCEIVPLNTFYQNAAKDAYFKDLFNDLDKFIGTWTYTNGTEILIITFQKKEMIYDDEFFEDLLIGEYRYLQNGIEIANTLPLLNDINIVGRYHNISGRHITSSNRLNVFCPSCSSTEKLFQLNFHDPERNYLSTGLLLRYLLNETNPEKITVKIYALDGVMLPYDGAPTQNRVPNGEYLMEKQ